MRPRGSSASIGPLISDFLVESYNRKGPITTSGTCKSQVTGEAIERWPGNRMISLWVRMARSPFLEGSIRPSQLARARLISSSTWGSPSARRAAMSTSIAWTPPMRPSAHAAWARTAG